MSMTLQAARKAAQAKADLTGETVLVVYDEDLAENYGPERAYWTIQEDDYDPDEQHSDTRVMGWAEPTEPAAAPILENLVR